MQLPADVHEPSGLAHPLGHWKAHGAVGQPAGGQLASQAHDDEQRTPAAQLPVPPHVKVQGPAPHTVEKLQLSKPSQATVHDGALAHVTRVQLRSPVHVSWHAAVPQSMP